MEENEKQIENEPTEVENSESIDTELIDSETNNIESTVKEEVMAPDSPEMIEDLEESEIEDVNEDTESLESELPQQESLETQMRNLQVWKCARIGAR